MTKKIIPSSPASIKICTVEGCPSNQICKTLCRRHYSRLRLNGSPHITARDYGKGDTFQERFWSRVALMANPEKCWEWQGSIESISGYGNVKLNYKTIKAHRAAWFLIYGKFPDLDLLHSCDNRKCVNPNHLREGTAKENSQDMVDRKRSLFGERHNNAKLKESEVKFIKKHLLNDFSDKELAEMYDVGNFAIYGIRTGRTWKHVKI